MARIRSIHPGLFTDEAFASLSDAAQIFLIGLWTECDDRGAFEWKPVTLRMRLRPVKDGSVEPLLAELQAVNIIRSYEHDGRQLGLVRNFCRFQRPKKPNSVHFIPHEFRTYVGLTESSSEPKQPEPIPIPQKGEIAPQMEDGGEEKEEEESSLRSPKNGARSPPKAASTPRKHRLLDDWFPEPKDNDAGYEVGLTEPEIEREYPKFRDWAVSTNALKSNWNATWRNWLRTAGERKASYGKVHGNAGLVGRH
jgi:hypothetical protein